jgi:hypothetical protein
MLQGFFHDSSSSKPLKITLGSFGICSKNSQRYSQLKVHQSTEINDTGGKFAAGINYTGGNLPVSTTLAVNFPAGTAGVVDTCGKFAACVKNTGGKLPQVSIIETISDYLHLKVKLKETIYLYVNSTNHRCPNKIIKTFLIEDFFRVNGTGGEP